MENNRERQNEIWHYGGFEDDLTILIEHRPEYAKENRSNFDYFGEDPIKSTYENGAI